MIDALPGDIEKSLYVVDGCLLPVKQYGNN